jgi:hypothetical protein
MGPLMVMASDRPLVAAVGICGSAAVSPETDVVANSHFGNVCNSSVTFVVAACNIAAAACNICNVADAPCLSAVHLPIPSEKRLATQRLQALLQLFAERVADTPRLYTATATATFLEAAEAPADCMRRGSLKANCVLRWNVSRGPWLFEA